MNLNQDTLELFKTLTELPGTPGTNIRSENLCAKQLEKYTDEIVQDRLGGSLV